MVCHLLPFAKVAQNIVQHERGLKAGRVSRVIARVMYITLKPQVSHTRYIDTCTSHHLYA